MSNAFKNTFSTVKRFAVDHGPEILTGIGIAGMLTATVLAVSATPKALEAIEAKKKEEGIDKLPPIAVVKTTWKMYVPAAATSALAMTCLIGASSTSVKRNAALATAYKISETALSEYRNAVIETIGEKKEKDVREKVDKNKVTQNPVNPASVVITKKGTTLCMDGFSRQYFESDIDELGRAVTRLNAILVREGSASLNDLYDELDIPHSEVGYQVGWNIDKVGRDLIELQTSAQIANDGRPCIVLNCYPAPDWGYDRY